MVHHELPKSCETINGARYQQQIVILSHTLIVKQPQWGSSRDKVILLPDNASPRASKPLKYTLKDLDWVVFITPLAVISLVMVDGSYTVPTAFPNVRRYDLWEHSMVCLQRSKVQLGRYPHLTSKIAKICSKCH
ncbi:hypothetical protein AVEN_68363-1 [Araneus ventricosus]|uniref:Uncharacterized protein n=1 Tax=Araneus ventricosus TaxID=182803 RepID=A0A4Y2FZS4_ARAVE|nr:hypothetical protein AVEN_68363-1 [Araneus ventricosus]